MTPDEFDQLIDNIESEAEWMTTDYISGTKQLHDMVAQAKTEYRKAKAEYDILKARADQLEVILDGFKIVSTP
jgi:hypothetical protein